MTPARPPAFVAVDLGADSGRVIAGVLSGGRLSLTEVHRFANGPVRLPEGLRWDVLRLWSEISDGLCKAAASADYEVRGVAVDTWGVDFALVDAAGQLLGNPAHYRDDRTDGMLEAACAVVPRQRIYRTTGTQLMEINTLYQLLSLARAGSPQLREAAGMLMMPDLFGSWLSGRRLTELSIASTSQCMDPARNDWARPMLAELGIPTGIFGEIVPGGTVLGPLIGQLGTMPGLARAAVVASGSHDTASAAAAVPAEGPGFAWLSSGTWSIMGVESAAPLITDLTASFDLSNEAGVAGRWQLLRTMPGMWLLQECRRAWAAAGDAMSYEELCRLAESAPAFAAIVDPEEPSLQKPGDMPAKIRDLCQSTGQRSPQSKGDVVRCALESVALQYRRILGQLEQVSGGPLSRIHIVGGGSRNELLCRMTADATQRVCVVGPVEATAAGNSLVQAMALGELADLAEARAIVRRSFPLRVFEPGKPTGWDHAYARFLELKNGH